MKLILIGLAFLQFALAQNGGPATQFYEELNWRRGRFANDSQIANMYYMSYDTSLDTIIKAEVDKYGKQCPPSIIVRNGNFEIFLDAGRNETMRHSLTMTPGRTRVATYSVVCDGEARFNAIIDIPTTKAIHGPPGSKCADGWKTSKSHWRYLNLCVPSDFPDEPARVRRDTPLDSFIDTDSLKDKLLEIVQEATEKISEYVQDEEIIENAADAILQAARDTVEELTSPYTRKTSADPESFKIREESEEEIQKSID